MKTAKLLAAALPLLAIGLSAARAQMTVTVRGLNGPNNENIIRTDIGKDTFGSGMEHCNYKMPEVMATPNATQTQIKQMNLGWMRFPMGTTALHYVWDNPAESHSERPGVFGSMLLTPQQMLGWTDASKLAMNRLFQVNTARVGPIYWGKPVVDPAFTDKATIHSANLNEAAVWARQWVQRDGGVVKYWEIGNEDWVYWTPQEYARIFNRFATEMTGPGGRSDIKLLAQSLTNAVPVRGKPDNDYTWLEKMIAPGTDTINRSMVHALSEHEYLHGGVIAGGDYLYKRKRQTEQIIAQLEDDWEPVRYLKQTIQAHGLGWQVWMTEMNQWPESPVDESGQIIQDMAHAVAIATWTGRLLAEKTDKIFMHSLDDNPYFSMIDYNNSGGTVAAPKITAPGHAFTKFAQEFGPKMVKNDISGTNPLIHSPSRGAYAQVAVYSSIKESDPVFGGYPSMRLMLVNRSMDNSATITVKTLNRPMTDASKNYGAWNIRKTYSFQELASPNVTDSNYYANIVKWSTSQWLNNSVNGITRILPRASVTFLIVPLE